MIITARADVVCPVCCEVDCQTWACSRCECVLTDTHLVPYGWAELTFDPHDVRGQRRHYFCKVCTDIVSEFVDMLTRGPR